MNIFAKQERLKSLLHKKWLETFPQYFIHCKTLDKEIHDTSNNCSYNHFLAIRNACNIFQHYRFNLEIESEWERMFDEINTTTDIRIWCIENIKI